MRIIFQTSTGFTLYIKEDSTIAGQRSKDEVVEVITHEIKKALEQDELLMFDTLSKLLYCILKEYTQL